MTAPDARWAVVIPIRAAASSKSRLLHPLRGQLARAFALDTVRAAARTSRVAQIVVVASGPLRIPSIRGMRMVQDGGTGLIDAVRTGLSAIEDTTLHRAVMLGDLPALAPEHLDAALRVAELLPRAFVPDADGTGTTLVTARAGTAHRLHFGAGSAASHRRAGYRDLTAATRSGAGLRRDVDSVDDLADAIRERVGPSTAAVLAGVSGS